MIKSSKTTIHTTPSKDKLPKLVHWTYEKVFTEAAHVQLCKQLSIRTRPLFRTLDWFEHEAVQPQSLSTCPGLLYKQYHGTSRHRGFSASVEMFYVMSSIAVANADVLLRMRLNILTSLRTSSSNWTSNKMCSVHFLRMDDQEHNIPFSCL